MRAVAAVAVVAAGGSDRGGTRAFGGAVPRKGEGCGTTSEHAEVRASWRLG